MRRLLALLLSLQAFYVSLVHAKEQPLELVVAEPYLEMHSGPGRGYPVVYVVGRDEVLTVLYSRTDWFKVRAPHGQEGWARRSELALTKLHHRGAGADPALSGIRHPSLGDRRGLRRVQPSESGHGLGRFRSHRQSRRRIRAAAGLGDASITAISRAWAAAYLHSRMALVLTHGGHRHRLSIHRRQSAAEAAANQQPGGLRVLGRARLHHQAIHVACGLAQVRRVHQPKSE